MPSVVGQGVRVRSSSCLYQITMPGKVWHSISLCFGFLSVEIPIYRYRRLGERLRDALDTEAIIKMVMTGSIWTCFFEYCFKKNVEVFKFY